MTYAVPQYKYCGGRQANTFPLEDNGIPSDILDTKADKFIAYLMVSKVEIAAHEPFQIMETNSVENKVDKSNL